MKRCVHWQCIYSEMTNEMISYQTSVTSPSTGTSFGTMKLWKDKWLLQSDPPPPVIYGCTSGRQPLLPPPPPKGHNDQAWKLCFYVEEQQSRTSNKWCSHYLHFNRVIFTTIAATWQRFCYSLSLFSLSLVQNYLVGAGIYKNEPWVLCDNCNYCPSLWPFPKHIN